jgi:SAM-dependent methyltransferase
MRAREAERVREEVRRRYALAAGSGGGCGCADTCCGEDRREEGCCGDDCCGGGDADAFGEALYDAGQRSELPEDALRKSLGCGNPVGVADLHEGETVLDLGSGGGIDVLLSARRVAPSGVAYGLDMTEEMLSLARRNAAEARIDNARFLEGEMEAIPLPSEAVDVVISNCVINLSADKPAVLAEIARVLRPGGRIGISDVVAEDRLTPAERAQRGSWVGCIAGALSKGEYQAGFEAVGLVDVEVRFTHEVADGLHAALVRARKPRRGEAQASSSRSPSRAPGTTR